MSGTLILETSMNRLSPTPPVTRKSFHAKPGGHCDAFGFFMKPHVKNKSRSTAETALIGGPESFHLYAFCSNLNQVWVQIINKS